MKIVKFKDGTYAIRRWTLFRYEYLGLTKIMYWWSLKFADKYCKGTLEQCEEIMMKRTDYGRVVKEVKNQVI